MRRPFLALALLALAAALAAAQTPVVPPTTLEFTPSPDHSATTINGAYLVVHYELRIYPDDGTKVPLKVIDLNKPTPDNNRIVIVNPGLFAGLAEGFYLARVVVLGPTGESASDPAVRFGVPRTTPPGPASGIVIR